MIKIFLKFCRYEDKEGTSCEGKLIVAQALDFETQYDYPLQLTVADMRGLMVIQNIDVKVIDANDPPTVSKNVLSLASYEINSDQIKG